MTIVLFLVLLPNFILLLPTFRYAPVIKESLETCNPSAQLPSCRAKVCLSSHKSSRFSSDLRFLLSSLLWVIRISNPKIIKTQDVPHFPRGKGNRIPDKSKPRRSEGEKGWQRLHWNIIYYIVLTPFHHKCRPWRKWKRKTDCRSRSWSARFQSSSIRREVRGCGVSRSASRRPRPGSSTWRTGPGTAMSGTEYQWLVSQFVRKYFQFVAGITMRSGDRTK